MHKGDPAGEKTLTVKNVKCSDVTKSTTCEGVTGARLTGKSF